MSKSTEDHRTPGYYIRKRLKNNRPAFIGLFIITGAIVSSLFGYLIMPDQTPDANDGAVQIQKQPPGFEATFLKIRKNRIVEKRNIFQKAIHGQESEFMIVPIKEYEINGLTVTVKIFGKDNYIKKYDLLDVVKPLYFAGTKIISGENSETEVYFTNVDGVQEVISYDQLVNEFHEKNIEKRTYWFGTDKMGRDMLSRLLFGTKISLSIGFISVLISLFLGMSLGSLAGFFGGRIDMVILWFLSVIWSIPGIILVISISMALQSRGVWVAFVAVGLTMWVDVARVMRGQIMAIKEKQFVEAARAFGIKNFRIVFVHILPNISGPLIVIATANFAAAILLEAGLGFAVKLKKEFI